MTLTIPLIVLVVAFVLFMAEGFLTRSLRPVALGFSVLAIGLLLGG